MINKERGHFMRPEYTPILEQLPPKDANPYKNFGALRRIILEASDKYATHPLVIAKELQLSRIDNELEATTVERARISRFGYVSDIHGLTDADFTKLRETLVAGDFSQVFFLGDIGGSEKLAKLQKLFYQGGSTLSDNQFYNKYQQLMKEPDAEQNAAVEAVAPGYTNLRSYEIYLESIGKLTEEEARVKAEEEMGSLSQDEIKQRILSALSHKHYGHYVSDLPTSAIISLQADVEHYYERFITMVQEIKSRGVEVFVLQGNWDARLPFDFEPNTETPIPLPQEKRRFNPRAFFKKRVPYFTKLGTVEGRDALHVMVPFDAVAGDILETIGDERLAEIKQRIDAAKENKKRVIMLAHAVPAWNKHSDKEPTGEGKITQTGLQVLAGVLQPDDLIYGHEHKARPDVEAKYKLRITTNGFEIGDDESMYKLTDSKDGIVASHLPIPSELERGIGTLEEARYGKGAPRGNGGKQSPIRIDRSELAHIEISKTLPTTEALYPQGRKK